MAHLALSFVIPAYNEQESLPKLLESIKKYTPAELSYEVIVADNGSTDATVNIAEKYNAKVIVDKAAKVGGLRNLAANIANGRVLVFVDADILLTEAWGENILEAHQSLLDDPWQVTGSKCGISAQPGWIERYWFKPLLRKEVNYINSGHLITSLELFQYLGGFDATLESGEDYAFSRAAAAKNAKILNNHSLVVVHEGYPRTLFQFIQREIWHGRGDCGSFRSVLASKVTILAMLFMCLHVVSLAGVLVFSNWSYRIIGFSGIAGICMAAASFKHSARSAKSLLIVSVLYYFYFLSRFLSFFSRVKGQY